MTRLKFLTSLILAASVALSSFAVDPGDYTFQRKQTLPGTKYDEKTLNPGSNTVFGFNVSGNPTARPIGDFRLTSDQIAWSALTGQPTTLSGYGITDGQPLDPLLTALAGLTTAADKGVYFTASDAPATFDLFTWGRNFLGAATESDGLNTLLPNQGSQDGKVLTTNGSTTSWTTKVSPPSTAVVNNSLPAWDGTSGTTLKDSGIQYTHLPLLLVVKNINVLTAGAPQDVATIPAPAWLGNFQFMGIGSAAGLGRLYATSASGTMSGASFTVRTGSGGGGTGSAAVTGPTAVNITSAGIGNNTGVAVYTSGGNLYLHQATNSANAGTVDVYVWILPMP